MGNCFKTHNSTSKKHGKQNLQLNVDSQVEDETVIHKKAPLDLAIERTAIGESERKIPSPESMKKYQIFEEEDVFQKDDPELKKLVDTFETKGPLLADTLTDIIFTAEGFILDRVFLTILEKYYPNVDSKEKNALILSLTPNNTEKIKLSTYLELIYYYSIEDPYNFNRGLMRVARRIFDKSIESTEQYLKIHSVQQNEILNIQEFLKRVGEPLNLDNVDSYYIFYRLKEANRYLIHMDKFIQIIDEQIQKIKNHPEGITRTKSKKFQEKENRFSKSEELRIAIEKVQSFLFPVNLSLRDARQKQFLEEVEFDENEKELVSKKSFFKALSTLNLEMTSKEKVLIVNLADKKQNEKIDLKGFLDFIEEYSAQLEDRELMRIPTKKETGKQVQKKGEQSKNKKEVEKTINTKKEAMKKLKQYSDEHDAPFESILFEFQKLDTHNEGYITKDQFVQALSNLQLGISERILRQFADEEANQEDLIDYESYAESINDYEDDDDD